MSIGTPCKTVELHITVGDDDLPEDRYSRHVNNARYFVFINRAFHAWYVKMGLRNADAPSGPVMAHTAYDFLRQVNPPGEVVCRITTSKVGRTSLEHSVEMWDHSQNPPLLAGRGRVVHVWINRATGQSQAWPADVLSKCWNEASAQTPSD
jgi:acyl-CoA thioesterase FadM